MNQQAKSQRKIVIQSLTVVVLMFGFGFALVPMYNVFCDVFGINGKTGIEATAVVEPTVMDEERWINVEFVTTLNQNMPWHFKPTVKKIRVHPGQTTTVNFLAENHTDREMVGQAIPSVSPGWAANYFKKTECFCFNHQPLAAGESKEMGVRFFIDPEIPRKVTTLTLSYTFFDITEKAKAPSNERDGLVKVATN